MGFLIVDNIQAHKTRQAATNFNYSHHTLVLEAQAATTTVNTCWYLVNLDPNKDKAGAVTQPIEFDWQPFTYRHLQALITLHYGSGNGNREFQNL